MAGCNRPRAGRSGQPDLSGRNVGALADQPQSLFVDVCSALADENGDLKAEYSSDGLHMVAAGYKAWADCLAGHVAYSADNPYVMGSEYYIAE